MKNSLLFGLALAMLLGGHAAPVGARQLQHTGAVAGTAPAAATEAAPAGFIIGVGDILSVMFWHDEKLSREVLVRPDGKISLPLLNDVHAAGNTPEQLAAALAGAAVKYITEPDVTVIVKEIHSRKVFVVGQVVTPGAVPLIGNMTVLQVLGVAGGLHEYADKKHIVIIRKDRGLEKRLAFNYEDVVKGKNTWQNILLQPDDTVVVP